MSTNKRSKVLIIGIDSMDRLLLEQYLEDLPTFREVKEKTPPLNMKSVFPPDSDTAWASIYTGLYPTKHGVVTFVDPLEKSLKIQTEESDANKIRGKTFWDYLTKKRHFSVILLPHIAYPPWEINGIFVSRSRVKDDVKSQSPDLPIRFDLSRLNPPKGVPKKDTKTLRSLVKKYKELVKNETNFFEKMIKNTDWNLFFAYSSALDAIQHYFWSYCDPTDPAYPGKNEFETVIREFYMLYDNLVRRLLNHIDENTIVLILSDHGHTKRPEFVVNLNKILKDLGLLSTSQNVTSTTLDRIKEITAYLVSKYNLGWIASKVLRFFPSVKDVYSKPSSIDWENTIAYTTDMSGIKSYTYGGIIINKNLLKNVEEYEKIREYIINNLSFILHPETGENLVEWVIKRESLYGDGEYLHLYPDILVQLKEGFGIGHKATGPLITKAHTSNIVPGSHRGDTPILFVYSPDKKINVSKKDVELVDIAPTILDLFGIDWRNYNMDGKSILLR
ncbi:alkaline phosphatase family protein [Thermococcus sibiricus]|uniref:Type I phosphodiesterase / nucleotide pyrophosphatase n=1 Tax=Thermococcus sibiricus TaxID=172049 RepID=A0A124FF55_9EURY|nr:alkaline phosphatase family protein [Thermococcus sibiricus]KUK17001.1 MAG: Type I phosphodiesterase / nucleotide pyrophosphatase [Thermococcus sibiricus]